MLGSKCRPFSSPPSRVGRPVTGTRRHGHPTRSRCASNWLSTSRRRRRPTNGVPDEPAAAVRMEAQQGVLPQVAPEQPQSAIRGHLLEDTLGGQLLLDQSSQARYPSSASGRPPVGDVSSSRNTLEAVL